MAPESSFVELIKTLNENGFKCEQSLPLWHCIGKDKTYGRLQEIEFNVLVNEKQEIKKVRIPPPSYLKYDDTKQRFVLFITPWQFAGMGGK